MSKTLQDFYLAYAQWLADGAPEQKPFSSWNGLCHTLFMFCVKSGSDHELANQTKAEMLSQFVDAGLNETYPFDLDSFAYEESGRQYECHLNPKRIQWVRDQVAKIKEEVSS